MYLEFFLNKKKKNRGYYQKEKEKARIKHKKYKKMFAYLFFLI